MQNEPCKRCNGLGCLYSSNQAMICPSCSGSGKKAKQPSK